MASSSRRHRRRRLIIETSTRRHSPVCVIATNRSRLKLFPPSTAKIVLVALQLQRPGKRTCATQKCLDGREYNCSLWVSCFHTQFIWGLNTFFVILFINYVLELFYLNLRQREVSWNKIFHLPSAMLACSRNSKRLGRVHALLQGLWPPDSS